MRSVLLTIADTALRQRLRVQLEELRWLVREAGGGAEALSELERELPEIVVVDSWLPDLHSSEFSALATSFYPHLDLVGVDGSTLNKGVRSERRHELLTALREANTVALASPARARTGLKTLAAPSVHSGADRYTVTSAIIGASGAVIELLDMIRLVAPFDTTVLIEGETGTGKELVAHAIHQYSLRNNKPFVVLNCAAIPEALLEAELFGHTRGAFTGAVQARQGRIEAADSGTLFLDEIGEMPLALQAKMLRFLENGELQRVGDNTLSRVDVRIVAATHRELEQRSEEGSFRLDLYHRLAVFPISVPPLRERLDDVVALAEHALERLGARGTRKRLTPDALEELLAHHWPGNVRELMHVVERAVILSADRSDIQRGDIRIRKRPRN